MLVVLTAQGVYDHATVHALIDAVPVLHVAFNPPASPSSDEEEEPVFPVILPMIGCTATYPPLSEGEDGETAIYLHGAPAARLLHQDSTLSVTVSATALDGIVLATSPFNHSCNYRSAVAFGEARAVRDEGEERFALRAITENLVKGRWSGTRGVTVSSD